MHTGIADLVYEMDTTANYTHMVISVAIIMSQLNTFITKD